MIETIRTTIFPIFLISSISFTIGIISGLYLGIVEDNIIAFTSLAITVIGVPTIIMLDRHWSGKKRIIKS